MRVLSGIQPTGRFHWGNYFGAIRQYIDLQNAGEAYYFIANLHALTTLRDPAALRQNTLDAGLDLLALGLDPAKTTLLVQSNVRKVPDPDGEKMSRTYDNPLEVLEDPKAMRKKVRRIATASRPREQLKPGLENDHLSQLSSLFAPDAKKDEIAALSRRGNFGYGQV